MHVPGPPLGPRYLNTTTVFSPLRISPFSTTLTSASSESKVRARPVNPSPSLPVILATAPPGARFPRRILCWCVYGRQSRRDVRLGRCGERRERTECVQMPLWGCSKGE
jgi:hypothetical protein